MGPFSLSNEAPDQTSLYPPFLGLGVPRFIEMEPLAVVHRPEHQWRDCC
jgi:hypothetical protein